MSFILQPEDVYDTSSKQQLSDQLRIWESENVHSNPKNAEAYEIEKRDVIVIVNNFVTKLYIESQRFKNNGLTLDVRNVRLN